MQPAGRQGCFAKSISHLLVCTNARRCTRWTSCRGRRAPRSTAWRQLCKRRRRSRMARSEQPLQQRAPFGAAALLAADIPLGAALKTGAEPLLWVTKRHRHMKPMQATRTEDSNCSRSAVRYALPFQIFLIGDMACDTPDYCFFCSRGAGAGSPDL